METTRSCLFFYLLMFGWSCFNTQMALSQTAVDSTDYYYQLAMQPKEDTDLVSAYNFFIKHQQACLDKKHKEGAIYDLIMLTIIQKESGFYHDSEASAIEALSLLDEIRTTDFSSQSKITLYNELGKVNRALKEYDRAMNYYDKALNIATKPEDLNRIYNNRAVIFTDQNNYDLASLELQKAYQISVDLKDEVEMARNLDNLGLVASKLKDPLALQHLKQGLAKRVELNDVEGLYASYKHLFIYYKDRKEPQTAKNYLDSALHIATQLNNDAYKLNALSEYMELDQDSLVRAYKTLNDQVKLDNLLAENKFASKKYDYTRAALEAQVSKNNKERTQILLGFVVVLAAFFYVILRARHKKANREQVYQTEARLSKKIHDELANDMSDLMNYVETDLQIAEGKKTRLLNSLEDVYLRTRDISTESASIDFNNFSESLKHVLVQHNKKDVQIVLGQIDTIDWKRVSDHKKLAVYRTLQELMVNMKKHSQATLVTVMFKSHKNKNEIWYTDDGCGDTLEHKRRNGLSNAEFRIKEIGGKLTFETSQGNGFKAIIAFNS